MKRETYACLLLACMAIVLVSSFTAIPVKTYVYPDGTFDTRYESCGPYVDQVIIKMHSTQDAMWTALANGEIDLTDSPLTTTWRDTFTSEPYVSDVNVVSAGGGADFYTVDFNYNPNEGMGSPLDRQNPVYIKGSSYVPQYPVDLPPVSNDVSFRLGVNCLFDRAAYNIYIGSAGTSILTPVPAYMGGPGGWGWEACPGTPYSRETAESYFAAAGIKQDKSTTPWTRYWDKNEDNVPQQAEKDACVLRFTWGQNIFEKKAGEMVYGELHAMNFTFNLSLTGLRTAAQNYQQVMLDKNYHMTTLCWMSIGPDPDYLYNLYNIDNYWDNPESSCPNTAALNDTVLNLLSSGIKFALTQPDAKQDAILFQERFWQIAAQIPLCSSNMFKASRKWYSGGNGETLSSPDDGENLYRRWPNGSKRAWFGFCNEAGFGSNSRFSLMNAYPDMATSVYGSMTLRYGWSEQGFPQSLNPFYSTQYWDDVVLRSIYEPLGYRNPYDLSTWESNLLDSWAVGTWTDVSAGGVNKSRVIVTLNPGLSFQDGTPITIADVTFSLVEAGKELVAHGYPLPYSWPTTRVIKAYSIINPYTAEILYDVSSYLVEEWTLSSYIVPRHIWQPIIQGGNPTSTMPDPNMVGSGPFRYKSWTPLVNLVLVANNPGSTVVTDRPGATPITSPGYCYPAKEFIYLPPIWLYSTFYLWNDTLRADICGSTLYDDIGFSTYPYKNQLPTPDFKVDVRDVARVCSAFGATPGYGLPMPGRPIWDSVSDIYRDWRINVKDVSYVCSVYGEKKEKPVDKDKDGNTDEFEGLVGKALGELEEKAKTDPELKRVMDLAKAYHQRCGGAHDLFKQNDHMSSYGKTYYQIDDKNGNGVYDNNDVIVPPTAAELLKTGGLELNLEEHRDDKTKKVNETELKDTIKHEMKHAADKESILAGNADNDKDTIPDNGEGDLDGDGDNAPSEDKNGNGILDPGEDTNGDGNLDFYIDPAKTITNGKNDAEYAAEYWARMHCE